MVIASELAIDTGACARTYGNMRLATAGVYNSDDVAEAVSNEVMQPAASPVAHGTFCWTAAVSRMYANGNSHCAGSVF